MLLQQFGELGADDHGPVAPALWCGVADEAAFDLDHGLADPHPAGRQVDIADAHTRDFRAAPAGTEQELEDEAVLRRRQSGLEQVDEPEIGDDDLPDPVVGRIDGETDVGHRALGEHALVHEPVAVRPQHEPVRPERVRRPAGSLHRSQDVGDVARLERLR